MKSKLYYDAVLDYLTYLSFPFSRILSLDFRCRTKIGKDLHFQYIMTLQVLGQEKLKSCHLQIVPCQYFYLFLEYKVYEVSTNALRFVSKRLSFSIYCIVAHIVLCMYRSHNSLDAALFAVKAKSISCK